MKRSVCFVALFFLHACFLASGWAKDDVPRSILLGWDKNLLTDFSPLNSDDTINAVIEIPAGTNEKWEVHKKKGCLELEYKNKKPRIVKYLGYPGNYGFVPRTVLSKAFGGDGDPLDIVVIGGPLARGSVAKAKLIGVLKLFEKGEQDDKLISVLPGSGLYEVDSIEELDKKYPGATTIIETWFLNYKGKDVMESKGYDSVKKAREVLKIAIEHYEKQD